MGAFKPHARYNPCAYAGQAMDQQKTFLIEKHSQSKSPTSRLDLNVPLKEGANTIIAE